MIKFRKGDKVQMIGTVKYDSDTEDGNTFVTIDGEFRDLHVKHEGLTLVTPQFEEGDSMAWETRAPSTIVHGTIISIRDGHAWIDLHNGDYCTRLLTTVTRVFHEEIPA